MKAGSRQVKVMKALNRHGSWYSEAGWNWGTFSETRRVMESLAAKGLVSKSPGARSDIYKLTETGKAAINQ